ncbi:MAG: hydroxymethylglutaryl-CoA reductase, degradative [Gammaproteobacteria bacterium]|nr:hydroxymethylglutaryl-CoA reductase, degradative [Gammaproteobacteria bacterium]
MALKNKIGDLFKGFSKLTRPERLSRLVSMGALTPDDVKYLAQNQGLSPNLAEQFIENVIGYFQLPLGVATNFRVDGHDYVIPMAVEETSIIAALSKNAKWIRESGEIHTDIQGEDFIGQIQFAKVHDFEKLKITLEKNKNYLINLANTEVAANMVKRGGGVKDLQLRHVMRPDKSSMAVLHVLVNTCNAMGANLITQICEFLKHPIETLSQEHVSMCILSNLCDTKITRAHVVIHNVDPLIAEGIAEASLFAESDPYRAATSNKGALNGMDPVLIATGNDWRAVEAGVHAFAAHKGRYTSITHWEMRGNDLIGKLEAPIMVGIVGGVTRLHPTAKMCLNMLGVESADELSRVVAAVGLVQNLGAIRALTTFGFIQGHMKLHISNLTLEAGARGREIPLVKKRLEEVLLLRQRITLSNAIDILRELRNKALYPHLAMSESE